MSRVEPGSRRSPGGAALADGGSAVDSSCGYFIPNGIIKYDDHIIFIHIIFDFKIIIPYKEA